MSGPLVPVIYRGPLERSRLQLLLGGIGRAWGAIRFIWLNPGHMNKAGVAHLAEFLGRQAVVADWEVLDGRYAALASVRQRLRSLVPAGPLVVIGEDVVDFVQGTRGGPYIWCVNGIPEEKGNHLRSRMITAAEWQVRRHYRRPDLVVTVSDAMTRHYATKLGGVRGFAVPCTVSLGSFVARVPLTDRLPVIAYLGSGAVWQALPLTAAAWRIVAARRPDVQFRVVSRDPRTKVLCDAVDGRGEMVSTQSPVEVSAMLQTARVGCLFRDDNLVNRVAFPTKLGEYVASGVTVASTDLDWDVGRLISRTGCGRLASRDAGPEELASLLIALVDAAPGLDEACRQAALELGEAVWSERLAAALLQVVTT